MDHPEKRTLTKRGIKKMDAVVTGLILGGIVASIYGIKKNEATQERIKKAILVESDKHTLGSVLRMLVFGTQQKPEKVWFFARIARFFRRWND